MAQMCYGACMKRITVALPDREYTEFRVQAAKRDSSMGAVARSLILNWLEEQRGTTENRAGTTSQPGRG